MRHSTSERLRDQVLDEEHQCRICGRPGYFDDSGRHSLDVDHVLPLWAGGAYDRGNLQALCNARRVSRSADILPTNLSAHIGSDRDGMGRHRIHAQTRNAPDVTHGYPLAHRSPLSKSGVVNSHRGFEPRPLRGFRIRDGTLAPGSRLGGGGLCATLCATPPRFPPVESRGYHPG